MSVNNYMAPYVMYSDIQRVKAVYSQFYCYMFHYHNLIIEGDEHRRKYEKKEERPDQGIKSV
jgi:hypothetical protein